MSAEWLLGLRFALAVLLYGFLGVAFYVLWLGLRQQAEPPADYTPATLIMEAGEQAGRQVVLRPITAIGRADDNQLVLEDPFASSNHAMLVWREEQWWLEDLESHNGTFLNGEQVERPQPLTTEDRIRIGETVLVFRINGSTEKRPSHH